LLAFEILDGADSFIELLLEVFVAFLNVGRGIDGSFFQLCLALEGRHFRGLPVVSCELVD
jgi:hypothetical protein